MKLGKLGTIGGLRTFEEREDDERRQRLRQVREERLRIARASHYWTEIPDDLVERDRGHFRVSATSDLFYTRVAGVVFQPHSVTVIADRTPYCFTVSEDGELTFYERQRGTWSEHLEQRAARELAKAAPKPRRVPAESQ